MQILVDYFGISSKSISFADIRCLFGFDYLVFKNVRSNRRYKYALWYPGVSIHYNSSMDWYVELSGSGCRVVEKINKDFTWEALFEFFRPFILNKLVHVSRIDVACDDLDNNVSFPKMFQHLRQDKFVTRSRYCHWSEGSEQSIYVGSPKSDKRLRVYNKALEQGLDDMHWIRFEFQLRNDEALQFLINLYHYDYNFAYLFLGFLNKTIRFTQTVVDKENNHTSRAKIADWWLKFCKGIKNLNYLRLIGKEYDTDALIRYIKQSCGSSIKTFLELSGGDINGLLDLLHDVKINTKQQLLLQDFKKE